MVCITEEILNSVCDLRAITHALRVAFWLTLFCNNGSGVTDVSDETIHLSRKNINDVQERSIFRLK